MHNIKSNKAFTLIELIVVMAIVAVLVLLAAPRFLGYTKDAKVTAMQQDIKVLSDASELYHIDTNNWPITGDVITDHGIGGVDELYPLDKSKLESSIKNIRGDYDDYGMAIDGNHAGQVFHLEGVIDRFGVTQYGSNPLNPDRENVANNEPVSVVFEGVHYESIRDVPESPVEWFKFTEHENGESYYFNGFVENIEELTNDGENPLEIAIPSTYKGKPVTHIAYNKHGQGIVQGLNNIVIPESIVFIDKYAFSNNDLTELYIPNSVTHIGQGAFNKNKLSDGDAFVYKRNGDGTQDKTTVVSYGGANQNRVVIPNQVKELGGYSFHLNKIKEIVYSKELETIGDHSLEGNLLTEVVIPSTVKKIGSGAFNSNKITNAVIPNNVTNIGVWAFNRNQLPDDQAFIYARKKDGSLDKETIVSYGGANRHMVTIPDGVKKLDNYSFYSNNIQNVIIPDTVTSINYSAFRRNKLSTVHVPFGATYHEQSFDEGVTILQEK